MSLYLSHSAFEKFKTCPQMYKLHYLDRLRSEKKGSALLFGNALDEALNVLLSTKLDNPPDTATDDLERLKQGFEYHLSHAKVGDEIIDIRTDHVIEYYTSDFDDKLLLEEDWEKLEQFIKLAGYISDPDDPNSGPPDPLDLFEEIKQNIKDKRKIDATDQSYFNYASWLTLKNKGHLLLELYKEEIMPQIKRVVSIQKKVELPNEQGDVITGYIDFEAEFVGKEGIYTVDNKTSGSNYKKSDINEKGQLPLYDEFTQNGKAAYVVLLKKIGFLKEKTCQKCGAVTTRNVKKCAEGGKGKDRCNGEFDIVEVVNPKYQILFDEIDEGKKDLLFEEICDILEKIEEGDFPQDRSNQCFQYGKPCIYYNYCRSNPMDPDTEGLKYEVQRK